MIRRWICQCATDQKLLSALLLSNYHRNIKHNNRKYCRKDKKKISTKKWNQKEEEQREMKKHRRQQQQHQQQTNSKHKRIEQIIPHEVLWLIANLIACDRKRKLHMCKWAWRRSQKKMKKENKTHRKESGRPTKWNRRKTQWTKPNINKLFASFWKSFGFSLLVESHAKESDKKKERKKSIWKSLSNVFPFIMSPFILVSLLASSVILTWIFTSNKSPTFCQLSFVDDTINADEMLSKWEGTWHTYTHTRIQIDTNNIASLWRSNNYFIYSQLLSVFNLLKFIR